MIFDVALPIADPKELPSRDLVKPGARVRGRRPVPTVEEAQADGSLVLMVDDHPTNRALLMRQLNLLGYAAEAAEDGRQALKKWESGRFAIVVTDCNMPEMDGYELARAIRKDESVNGGSRIPIIACTANALEGDADRCIAAGMDDFLAKPVEIDALANVLDRWRPIPSPGSDTGGGREIAPASVADDAPVDRSKLAEITGGDAAMEREILIDFRGANDADARMLLDALEKGDVAQVTRASHRMKGACRMVGAMPLADVCERMEQAGRRNDWNAVAGERAGLEREFERLNAWLSKS
jgi:CheY-like chemotaxis protein/HPt (histidine-containing phosphotransfer) domain-containing protein